MFVFLILEIIVLVLPFPRLRMFCNRFFTRFFVSSLDLAARFDVRHLFVVFLLSL